MQGDDNGRQGCDQAGGGETRNGVAHGHNGLPHLIDVATLAEDFALTERTIRRKVAQREIPYYRLGNSIRFDPVEIHACLKASRVAAHTSNPVGAKNGTRT